jgi:RimJ/RimL family protein N-acetyltransferase
MALLEGLPVQTCREASIPVLETERLVLRAPRFEDAKAIAQIANDRRIAENTARIPHPYGQADAEAFIETVAKGEEMALLIAREDEPIGACGLATVEGGGVEVGYWIGAPFWGNGYATEALQAIIDHAFTDLDIAAVHGGARVTNPASRRVLEKCGFQWTGVGLCRVRALSSSVPIDRFRLEKSIWTSLKSWGVARRAS